MNKVMALVSMCFLATGCFESDESNHSHDRWKSTYSSCQITYSDAVYSKDRSTDLRQCWDGVDYRSESRALDWCGNMVNDYMTRRYTFGHTVEYRVSASYCNH